MRVFLLHPDRDVEVRAQLRDELFGAMVSGDLVAMANIRRNADRGRTPSPAALSPQLAALAQDLELDTLWNAMAAGDEFLRETAKRVVLSSLRDPVEIRYRQSVLADCLDRPEVVRELYGLALEAVEGERKAGSLWHRASPSSTLHRSLQLLGLYIDILERVRELAEQHAAGFRSEGFRRFFSMVREELSDEYLEEVELHLGELAFKRGVFQSARLGRGDKAVRYTVHKRREEHWTERLPFLNRGDGCGFTIPSRDENGFKALDEIRNRGLNQVANAVGRSADHVKSFFGLLRFELAFYLGCLNLHEQLDDQGEPVCMPDPIPAGELAFGTRGLYDVCLTFHVEGRVVGNDIDAGGRSLVMITGANQGGKSTFLRSLGLAQLMMQSGMFVGAESFRADVSTGVFTHYKREEDAGMEGGKLDEELGRMSAIADEIAPGAMLLCNESFASTNEREGSEIARQVIRALLDKRIRVVFVTHMYDLAHGFHTEGSGSALFLRPERGPDGERTFKLTEGEPLATSYGQDSYRRIFGQAETQPADDARHQTIARADANRVGA